MATEIRVPQLGESVTEATIAKWFKAEGETVAEDEPIVELETDKVTVEVPAPSAGVLSKILVKDGDTVEVGALLGSISDGNGKTRAAPAATPLPSAAKEKAPKTAAAPLSPAVRRIVEEKSLDTSAIEGSGKGGRITKADALKALEGLKAPPRQEKPRVPRAPAEREERVPMTRLRQTIARRLKEAQDTAAMLTTFNEVDMSGVLALRERFKDAFEEKHQVRLGLMGFFVKACVTALKDIPSVNAEIDGTDIVYKNHYDVGIAVAVENGLVVPVVRDADALSLAEIERAIADYAARARAGALKLDELQGGTFTISNGGVYGSLMSTPILNAPQSGILGMHKIEKRPVVVNDEILVRPMMYLALSYDHRLVDGKEAVTFLVRVKDLIEAPERLVLDL